jgi:hypothetical protein
MDSCLRRNEGELVFSATLLGGDNRLWGAPAVFYISIPALA